MIPSCRFENARELPMRPSLTLPFLAVLLTASPAPALIDPKFTPIDLVLQSSLIAEVELKPGDSKDRVIASIRAVLKGRTDLQPVTLDLSQASNTQTADALRNLVKAAGKSPALFFAGEGPKKDGAEHGTGSTAFLHVAGQWAALRGGAGNTWALDQIDARMQGVWAGGTDMLRRAVDYILAEPRPHVPVAAGAVWQADPVRIGKVEGRIRAARPVDLAGDGKLLVFVASDGGDRLFALDAKGGAKDVTAARKLQSKSRALAWGDFSGAGRLDLASCDGAALALHVQQADGAFAAKTLDLPGSLAGGCTGLAALDGGKGRACLLVSTGSGPVLVALEADGRASATPLGAKGADLASLGNAGVCLVADFDGDALPDILQLFAKGSLLYKGLGPGKFAAPARCAVCLGEGEAGACLGDFDGDGRLDIFTVAEDACRLWQNDGGGKFTECLNQSGEIAYISKAGGVDCMAGDVNNDGRQDILVAYAAQAPHVFFNRGWRSFGHAHTMDVAENRLLADAEDGQQAACLADFNGDGAQDMVLALKNGELWILYRENESGDACAATAALPIAGPCKGPVAVTGRAGKWGLGAWNVVPGTAWAFFGLPGPGPLVLNWALPGGAPQQKEIAVGRKPVRFQIK
jgi:hypothetical protein